MSRNDMGGARRGVMAHSIGWPNATEFYLSIEWYSDEDRAHALGILFGAALNALHEVDGQAVWEHRPGRSGTGWTTAGYARVTIRPTDVSLPFGGPLHRRIVRDAYHRADGRRARLIGGALFRGGA